MRLAEARVLIVNDDGVDAPGLAVLERAVAPLVREVWIVAPEHEQSAASHSITMRRPLYARARGQRRFAVDGTPTDCVLLAVHRLMREAPPDLVLSGINRGGNMGEDATYSGTVAGAREGALLGIPAIAFSLYYGNPAAVRWDTAAAWTPRVLRRLAASPWPGEMAINVNVPDVAPDAVSGIEVTRQGRRKIGGGIVDGVDPRGERWYWIGHERDEDRGRSGTDLAAVHRGAVAVTPLAVDLTAANALEALAAAFAAEAVRAAP